MGFSDVEWPKTDDELIETKKFIESSRSIATFLAMLGKPYIFVLKDFEGNIAKIEKAYERNPSGSFYIQDLIANEERSSQTIARESLLWLKRGLHFSMLFLKRIVEECEQEDGSENLEVHCYYAYEKSLRPYHNTLIRTFFFALVKVCPTKSQVLSILKESHATQNGKDLIEKLKKYIEGLEENLKLIFLLYDVELVVT